MPDRIVVYSNGIADHQRTFTIPAGESRRIDLAVRRDHLADVLASLNVFGKVTLVAPPSFQPSDVDAGNVHIDTDNVLEGLATSLSGSRVEVERPSGTVRGTLLGLHREPEGTAGDPIAPASLVLLTTTGLRILPIDEVSNWSFEDEAVRDELVKALKRNFQRIKPHSTYVELTLAASDDVEESGRDVEAIVQYTLPAAAWKMTYRLREQEVGGYDLHGFAVVTNDTDDDWKQVLVSVVTGEPTTFSTDLAETKIPRRQHVDVVRGEALGSVEIEAAESYMAMEMDDDAMTHEAAAADVFGMQPRGRRMAMATTGAVNAAPAKSGSATAKDVGDFCVFESTNPVTIAARRSAVIPMFLTTLDETKTVLHYRAVNHAERPFRAVDFTNRTTYSLGLGVCTVYQSGSYAGTCVLPAMKPGEDRLLPHALETGVRVRQESKPARDTIVGLHIADGACQTSEHRQRETVYHVSSHREESYRFVLDHDRLFAAGELEATLHRETEAIAPLESASIREDGPRYEITLHPRDVLRVRVVETEVHRSSVQLSVDGDTGSPIQWLRQNLVATNGPLAQHPGIRTVLEIRERLDDKQHEIAEAEGRIDQLANRQERLRENVKAAGGGEQANRWRSDLASAEDQLTEIEESTLPSLHAEEAVVDVELRDALRSLAAEWTT